MLFSDAVTYSPQILKEMFCRSLLLLLATMVRRLRAIFIVAFTMCVTWHLLSVLPQFNAKMKMIVLRINFHSQLSIQVLLNIIFDPAF